MSSIRSSVRPKSSKQPWGTIIQPEFGMGYQRMTDYEIDQTVRRLYSLPDRGPRDYHHRPEQASLDRHGLKQLIDRLTKGSAEKAPDARRTQNGSVFQHMGVVNSYAWKGYN